MPWHYARCIVEGAEFFRVMDEAGTPVAVAYFENDAKLLCAAPAMLSAIESALRIEQLWMPSDVEQGLHEHECEVITMMRDNFAKVVDLASGSDATQE